MTNFLLMMLEISLTTSFAIGILLTASHILSKRYVARLRVMLWMVVALRLLIPVNFTLPTPPVQVNVPNELLTPFIDYSLLSGHFGTPSEALIDTGMGSEGVLAFSWIHVLFVVWLIGIACVLGFHSLSLHHVSIRLCRYAVMPGEMALTQYHKAISYAGVKKAPTFLYCPIIQTPMLVGIQNPVIYLPKKEYSGAELQLILCHELTHYKRKDLWVKWLLLTATAIHWFNPFVWLMSRKAGTDIELACDETVARDLDRTHRATYGHAILAATGRGMLHSSVTTKFGSSKNITKKRILSLFDFSRKRRGLVVLAGFLCLLVLAGGLVACVPKEPDTSNVPVVNSNNNQSSVPSGTSISPSAQLAVEGTITIDSVNILLYDNDPASPYIKDMFTNNTNQTIVGWSSGMLAFDAMGNPLQVDWYAADSSAERCFANVSEFEPYLASGYIIAPGETHDVNGGWSIFNEVDADGTCTVAYALYCFREITFEDGTVWTNPDYDTWMDAYCGKSLDTEILDSYYSSEQATVII